MSESPTPSQRLTGEEMAFLRFVEFGHLPPRVEPEDLVTGTEAEPRRQVADLPDRDATAG